jgi:hypothetical protein
MFLSPTSYDAARIWTPCVDSLWERCTWELEFIVDVSIMVVSSGELLEQVRPLSNTLTLDHAPPFTKQDHLLLFADQSDLSPAYFLCSRTLRDARHLRNA